MNDGSKMDKRGQRAEARATSTAHEVGSFLLIVLITMVSTLAIVGIGFGIGFGVWNMVPKGEVADVSEELTASASRAEEAGEASQDSSSASSAATAAESESVSSSSASSQDSNSAATSSQAAVVSSTASAGTNLAFRDADFAVDPARTDWNYADNGRKVVYLTIDDGPSENTQAVLDILDRYGCKATFFVVGQDPDHYYLIKEAYDRGHTIGLHTMSHDYAWVYSSVDAYFADLDQIAQVVRDQIGYVPCFIRFPGGSSNTISANYKPGIMSELVGAVQQRGYQYYDWNISSGDGSVHTADELYSYATEGNPPGHYDPNIVMLCHDSATKQTTVEALPRIIEYYQGMGYSFEAMDRNTLACHQGVAN